jgi:hypothetical protein
MPEGYEIKQKDTVYIVIPSDGQIVTVQSHSKVETRYETLPLGKFFLLSLLGGMLIGAGIVLWRYPE